MEAFCGSLADTEMVKVGRAFLQRLTDTLCYCSLMAISRAPAMPPNPVLVLLPSRWGASLPDYFDGVADNVWIGAQQRCLLHEARETRIRRIDLGGARAGCRCAARDSGR